VTAVFDYESLPFTASERGRQRSCVHLVTSITNDTITLIRQGCVSPYPLSLFPARTSHLGWRTPLPLYSPPNSLLLLYRPPQPRSTCTTSTMQLIVFPLLLVWAALTAGCAYPFNDNRLINTTLLTEFVTYVTDRGGDGWVTVTDPAGPKTAWPKTGSDGLISIPYCYEIWADENVQRTDRITLGQCGRPSLAFPLQETAIRSLGFMRRPSLEATTIPTVISRTARIGIGTRRCLQERSSSEQSGRQPVTLQWDTGSSLVSVPLLSVQLRQSFTNSLTSYLGA
jgi:hypothetical protein